MSSALPSLSFLLVLVVACGSQGEPAAGRATPQNAPAASPVAHLTESEVEPAPTSPPTPDLTTADGYWAAFRSAVRAESVSAILALTDFPLTTRGTSDHCPDVPHEEAAFGELWPQLLASNPGLGHRENMRGFVERNVTISDRDREHLEGGGQLRMGDFVFRPNSTGEFRFFYAYWSADDC